MKLLPKQLEYFKECVTNWKEQLGLHRYKIFIKAGALNGVAQVLISEVDGVAVITINEDLVGDEVDDTLNRAALHECLEILLHEITNELEKTCCDNKIDVMIHRVIRTLENLLTKNVS